MHKKFDVKHVRYELISSSHPGYKEVQVLFTHQGKEEKHFIFIKDEGKKNYIKEAKKIFKHDLESGKVVEALKVTPGGKHPILITSIAVVGVAAIAVAGFFTYKYLNNPEPTPTPAVSHKFTFNGEHCRINGSLEYTHDILESDKNVQYTIVADQEWKLPDTIACTDVAYNKDTGVITISEITKDITVNVSALANPTPGAMFTVSFDANGGELTDDTTNPVVIETHKTITLDKAPKLKDRAGYKTVDVVWKDKDNNTFTFGPEGTGTLVTENMILKANWGAIQTFTVHFHETNTITTNVEVNYGDKPVFYTPQGEEGDTFLGWFIGPEDEADEFPFDEPIYVDDMHAYAHWKKPGYVVMWVDHDGTILETDTGLEFGDTPHYDGETPVDYVEAPYIYKFTGWSPAITPINSDRIYTAQFNEKQKMDGNVIMSFNIPEGGKTIDLIFGAIEELEFDWGDGSDPEFVPQGQTEAKHFYTESGEYILTIKGDITDVVINNRIGYDETLTTLYLGKTITFIMLEGYTNLRSIIVDSENENFDSRDGCNAIISKKEVEYEYLANTLLIGCKNTIIPASVTSIGAGAFAHCSGLANIHIPSSVTSIGYGAFTDCSGLTNINIPDSVTSIGDDAFAGCAGLTNINIPDSVTSIGDNAFAGCAGLTNIDIPSSVTSIGDNPFAYCSSLETITVSEENTKYDSRDGCNAIIKTSTNSLITGCKSTTIPVGITSIGDDAFTGCSGLANINIPNSVTSIGDGAFTDCSRLTNIDIPSSVTSIGDNPFAYCSSLETITVSEENTKYDSRDGCNAIIEASTNSLIIGCNSTTIPDSITSIGIHAFAGCAGLTNINISKNVNSIASDWHKCAFVDCTNLESIIVDGDNQTYDSRENCNAIIKTSTNSLIIGCKNTTIPDDVTTINDSAFMGSGLTDIEIPNNVTTIGASAFENCPNLTSVNVCKGVIFSLAFKNCPSLSFVKISSDVTKFYNDAFSECKNLSVVDLTEFNESNIPVCNDTSFDNDNVNLKFYVAPGMAAKFEAATGWKEYNSSHFVETDDPPAPPVC